MFPQEFTLQTPSFPQHISCLHGLSSKQIAVDSSCTCFCLQPVPPSFLHLTTTYKETFSNVSQKVIFTVFLECTEDIFQNVTNFCIFSIPFIDVILQSLQLLSGMKISAKDFIRGNISVLFIILIVPISTQSFLYVFMRSRWHIPYEAECQF